MTRNRPNSALDVSATGAFSARIDGLDLAAAIPTETITALRELWRKHPVLCFTKQTLEPTALTRFARHFGPPGSDPFVRPMAGHPQVLEVRREPAETVMPFGSSWHSDWSFQPNPPAGTLLYARELPPHGGDTLFADGCAAWDALTPDAQDELAPLVALHSARRPYSPEGFRAAGGDQRSMLITPDATAWAVEAHPLVRTHPETGRKALWINPAYVIGIRDMPEPSAQVLIQRLASFATQSIFVHRHVWEPGMLLLWDNRRVQHCATGGYDGHRRVMLRVTIAGDRPR